MFPARNQPPVAVHVIVDAGSVRTPDRRSSPASTDSRTVALSVVRALTVRTSGPGAPGTCGTESGLLSGKLTPVLESVRRARPLIETFRVAVRLWANALRAGDARASASRTKTRCGASLTGAGIVQGNRHYQVAFNERRRNGTAVVPLRRRRVSRENEVRYGQRVVERRRIGAGHIQPAVRQRRTTGCRFEG